MLAVIIACVAPACAPSDPRRALESYAPARRIDAVQAVVRSNDPRLVSALVDRLDDEDVAVRMSAILVLERMTGRRLGYDGWAAAPDRRAAVDVWRRYLTQRAAQQRAAGHSGSANRHATPPDRSNQADQDRPDPPANREDTGQGRVAPVSSTSSAGAAGWVTAPDASAPKSR